MPVLSLWDPRTATLLWINALDRRFKETPKAREQGWFLGIFENSIKPQSLKDFENEEDSNHFKKRKL